MTITWKRIEWDVWPWQIVLLHLFILMEIESFLQAYQPELMLDLRAVGQQLTSELFYVFTFLWTVD